MKSKALSVALSAALLWGGMGLPVIAAGKSIINSASGKAVVKPKSKVFRGRLKVVDLNTKVIVLEGAKAQTFQITSETAIKKDDKPATLHQVAVGDPVTGYAREVAVGKWEARSLYAGKHTPKGGN